ncbi:MAG: hypothetical protein WCT37_04340 [Patescibacteria group bacterium]
MSQKSLYILIAVIAAIAALVSLSTKTNFLAGQKLKSAETVGGETAGWSAYQNEKYNYSLKYPTSWQLTEDSQQLQTTGAEQKLPLLENAEIFGVENTDQSGGYISLYIYINQPPHLAANPACQSLADCVAGFNQNLAGAAGWQVGEPAAVTLAGEAAMAERVDRPAAGWAHYYVFALRNNIFYTLRFTVKTGDYDLARSTFDKVLANFRWK